MLKLPFQNTSPDHDVTKINNTPAGCAKIVSSRSGAFAKRRTEAERLSLRDDIGRTIIRLWGEDQIEVGMFFRRRSTQTGSAEDAAWETSRRRRHALNGILKDVEWTSGIRCRNRNTEKIRRQTKKSRKTKSRLKRQKSRDKTFVRQKNQDGQRVKTDKKWETKK